MDSWENEARFVLEERRKDEALLFRDDDDSHSLHAEHDQFVQKWGFSYTDMWDLDKAIAMFILPRLAYFHTHCDSVPSVLLKDADDDDPDLLEEAEQKWNHILDTICDGLHLYIEKDISSFSVEERKLWADAKKLLFDYFECLWN